MIRVIYIHIHIHAMPPATSIGVHIQRAFFSVLVTVITSLIFYLLNHAMSTMLEMMQSGDVPFRLSSVKKAFTSYETTISQNLVKPTDIRERMDDIGGLQTIKESIRSQVLLPLRHPKIFFGSVKALHPPKGILFYGPPGTGKTMLARAIAAEADCPFLSLTLANLENKFFGESSKLLNATFSLARKIQPCVLFFDEIDGMIRTRSDHDQSCVYAFKTEFLTHMDGITTMDTDAVIVIGCTNCASKLDPAVKRRLPQQYRIDLPTQNEMVDIFALHLKDSDVSHSEIGRIVDMIRPGMSGSDISNIIRSAWTMRLMHHTRSSEFTAHLETSFTTAEEVYRKIGNIQVQHVIDALRAHEWLDEAERREAPVESEEDEAPPPELDSASQEE